ncbi:hypothetical protein ACYZT4_26450 [Pseudomonas sp. GB2N2]
MTTVKAPQINSNEFLKFVDTLNDAIQISELKADIYNIPPFKPEALESLEYNSKYPEGQCWHNCYQYTHHNGGNIVFGWLIFEIINDRFVAQNHAVIRSSNGKLIDPTYCSSITTDGVFIPDTRAKIQYKNLRAPGSFELLKNGETIWTDGEAEHKDFMYRYFEDSKDLQSFISFYVKDI